MRTFYPLPLPVFCAACLLLASFFPKQSSGQTYKKRTYANFQAEYRTGVFATYIETVFGSITNASQAADNSPRTASTITIPVGLAGAASVTQFLEFTTNGTHSTVRNIAAGTPVAVKFKVPSSLLGLLDGIEIGTYAGLNSVSRSIGGALAFLGTGPGNSAGFNASIRYPIYSGNTLLNALNGAGELELVLTPAQAYNGVYVKLSGNGLSLLLSTDLFHAYILEDAPLTCSTINQIVDVLSGVKGNALVNAASATGSVTSAWDAADSDPSLSTFSTMSTGAQLLSTVFQTMIFETPSSPGDTVKMTIQNPGGGLLELAALKGFSIQPYLGNQPVGSPISNVGTPLSLKLLPGGSNKYELSVAIPNSFDRIEILMGGITDALAQLRVYDVKRVPVAPLISSNGNDATNDTVYVYQGNSVALDATRINAIDSIRWYNSGGQLVANGSTYFIPSVIQEGMYYAETDRRGCTEFSARHSVYIKILPAIIANQTDRRIAANRGNRESAAVISIQNPVINSMQINISGLPKGRYRLAMNSMNGAALISKTIVISGHTHQETLSRPGNIVAGLYLVSIYDEQSQRLGTFKIIFR